MLCTDAAENEKEQAGMIIRSFSYILLLLSCNLRLIVRQTLVYRQLQPVVVYAINFIVQTRESSTHTARSLPLLFSGR